MKKAQPTISGMMIRSLGSPIGWVGEASVKAGALNDAVA